MERWESWWRPTSSEWAVMMIRWRWSTSVFPVADTTSDSTTSQSRVQQTIRYHHSPWTQSHSRIFGHLLLSLRLLKPVKISDNQMLFKYPRILLILWTEIPCWNLYWIFKYCLISLVELIFIGFVYIPPSNNNVLGDSNQGEVHWPQLMCWRNQQTRHAPGALPHWRVRSLSRETGNQREDLLSTSQRSSSRGEELQIIWNWRNICRAKHWEILDHDFI